MFIGREKELEQLEKELNKKSKSAILIYGKRRIGKSTLITEALKSFDGIVINHLCVQSTFEGNMELLYKSVSRALELPNVKFESIFDLFDYLGNQKKRIALVLDEYPYLKESKKRKEVDSYMQRIIDNLSSNIKLILCGSYISVMKELVEEDNPLFGRFTQILAIKEFDYYDASKFFPKLDVRSKIERYAVFGGSPYILSNLEPGASLKNCIMENLLPETSIFHTYIESIALQEIRKNYDVRILEKIGNGRKKYSELISALDITDNGYLDKQLKSLLAMETIKKEFPINKPNDKKKQFYSISDNLMRFYFTFLFGGKSVITTIGEENYYKQEILPYLNNFISLRFEEIARQYFMRQAKLGKIKNIEDIGTYWYDDQQNKKSGQFDCVLKSKDGYDFYECKYYEKPMSKDECEEEALKVKDIIGIPIRKIGFVCSGGFKSSSNKYEFITGEDLFKI